MFKSLLSSLFVISVIRNNQFPEAAALQFHTSCGRAWPRSPAVPPLLACPGGRGDPGKGMPRNRRRGRGREGRRGRVQGRTSRLKSQARGCISIFPAISCPQKPPPLLAALAGWGSRMRFQLLAADVPPVLAGAPEYFIQGRAVLLGRINCCQLLGEQSKKQGDWIYGRLFVLARGV